MIPKIVVFRLLLVTLVFTLSGLSYAQVFPLNTKDYDLKGSVKSVLITKPRLKKDKKNDLQFDDNYSFIEPSEFVEFTQDGRVLTSSLLNKNLDTLIKQYYRYNGTNLFEIQEFYEKKLFAKTSIDSLGRIIQFIVYGGKNASKVYYTYENKTQKAYTTFTEFSLSDRKLAYSYFDTVLMYNRKCTYYFDPSSGDTTSRSIELYEKLNGCLAEKKDYNRLGILCKSINYKYNERSDTLEIISRVNTLTPLSKLIRFRYDDSGRLTEKLYYTYINDSIIESSLEKQEKYKYKKNRLDEVEIIMANCGEYANSKDEKSTNNLNARKYYYDRHGNISGVVRMDCNDTLLKLTYDRKGNWIERITSFKSVGSFNRIILYY
jgi:hypothetical protein